MSFNEIQDLIKLINKSDLAEFKMKDKDFSLTVRTKKFFKKRGKTIVNQGASYPMMSSPMQTSSSPVHAPQPAIVPQQNTASQQEHKPKSEEAKPSASTTIEVKSPMVGTFYRSSSPDKPAFVKVGDKINVGDTVCIIEAMKLFNEIESEVSGTVVKVLVEDSTPIEYDQVLFLLEA